MFCSFAIKPNRFHSVVVVFVVYAIRNGIVYVHVYSIHILTVYCIENCECVHECVCEANQRKKNTFFICGIEKKKIKNGDKC